MTIAVAARGPRETGGEDDKARRPPLLRVVSFSQKDDDDDDGVDILTLRLVFECPIGLRISALFLCVRIIIGRAAFPQFFQ